eukprot:1534542-Pleurochrysis_carterae.AAC.1
MLFRSSQLLRLCRFLPNTRTSLGPACAPARPLVRWSHAAWLDGSGPARVTPWRGNYKAHCWPSRGRGGAYLSVSERSRQILFVTELGFVQLDSPRLFPARSRRIRCFWRSTAMRSFKRTALVYGARRHIKK